ncbi:MAG: aminoglycoside phosphotransferase family protein [Bacteroidota bacterium]
MNSGGKISLDKVLTAYFPDTSYNSVIPFGSGHINDTFLITNSAAEKYLLQRINHRVFQNIDGLMNNMERVTRHLQQKLAGRANSHFTSVQIIPTTQKKLFYQDEQGNYWRIITFIPNSVTYDLVTSEEQAYQAGYAFGYFQQLLSDVPGSDLVETIPQFHDMKSRFAKFDLAREVDSADRVKTAKPTIDFALSRREEMIAWHELVTQSGFPRRVTHNDTKFNNVLLEKSSQKAICVIDLDTVMPGVIGYDFGDAIRTIANTAEEDEPDLTKISVDLDYYCAFARGFLKESGQQLTTLEKKSLLFAPNYMTFIMGLRMLTDYLQGDVYYKTNHSEHNLQRAKAQFALVTKLEEAATQTRGVLANLL